jgi:methanethiol S-methyltransferase
MDDRTGFLAILLITLGYGAVHSLLASYWAKAHARRLLGAAAGTFYRLFFNTIAVITLLPLVLAPALYPGSILYILRDVTAGLAVLGQVISLLLLWGAFRQSRPAEFLGLRPAGASGGDDNLVTTGAYAIVRHPLYSTGLCALWLTPVMTTGILAFCIGITLYILVGSELEERRLIAEFGDAYRAYRKKTSRLIPFVF